MDLLERFGSEKRHPWELARYEVVKDLVDQNNKSFDGKVVLDVGCGDLFFLREFSNHLHGSTLYAVDTAFDNNRNGIEQHGIQTFQSLDELPNGENFRVDLIFLMDVIEHIREDEQFLKNLVQQPFVHDDTLIVITAPAFNCLYCSHDRFLGHYRRHTNNSLLELIKTAGLEARQHGYFFFSLIFPRYLEVLLEKIRPHDQIPTGTGISKWNGGAIATDLVKKTLVADYKVQKGLKYFGIQLPGLSNYALCTKLV